ncbi:MAG: hypothetical protein PWP24_1063 [Clostridiales bacterium]|nr:hypothetical protein [Clostridiales bacterium]
MENIIKSKGFTDFQLKYFAMLLMVMDHIHYFFEFTGRIPVWFSMLGRLSAPLFLFCLIEGFVHTRNRKKYFIQVYFIAVAMGVIQFLCISFLKRPDGFYPQNQMLATFSILLIILQGIDWCEKKEWAKGLPAILVPIALPFFAVLVGNIQPKAWLLINVLHFSILPLHSWIMDGGTFFILQGILMYMFHKNKKAEAIAFLISNLLIYGFLPFIMMKDMSIHMLITQAYEWMGSFAFIFMLAYNGERGRGNKKLFYWFYPAHIYVLYALSFGLYLWMQANHWI